MIFNKIFYILDTWTNFLKYLTKRWFYNQETSNKSKSFYLVKSANAKLDLTWKIAK